VVGRGLTGCEALCHQTNVLAAALGLAIVAGYALALWWLLRREGPWTFTALTALCGLALALRLVLTTDYPAGLNEDEPKNLACSVQALEWGRIFEESCNGPPYLLSSVFAAQLVPYIGFNRWAMRSYSLATGVLATPATFAVARAMGLAVGPGLAAAGLVAVLPWSIFYGRISLGGELIFHEMLLLAGLTRLIWAEGGWPDSLIAALGMCLLLWDYLVGKSMMVMPLVAAVLARGWRRAWCVAVIPLALLGWYAHLRTGPQLARVGFSSSTFVPGLSADLWHTFVQRTEWALWTFIWPIAQDGLFTMRSAAVHPVFILVLAGVGVLTGVRRGLFLLAGFVAGLLPGIVAGLVPGIVSGTAQISTHRTLMAFPFIALAAAAALNVLPWRWLRATAVTAVLLSATVWSIAFYFSPRFWGQGDLRFTFDVERTALNEVANEDRPAHLIVMDQIGYYVPRWDSGTVVDMLSFDNWLPQDRQAVTYLFTWQAGPLRAQYEKFLPRRVRPVGKNSFLVRVEAADWSWLRQYGWGYEMRCGDRVHITQVPFLYAPTMGPSGPNCAQTLTHVWRARWHGPETEMSLHFTGQVSIAARGLYLESHGFEQYLPFRLPADTDVTVTLVLPPSNPSPAIALFEASPGGERVPDWDRFTPLWQAETDAEPEVASPAPGS
jgi:hypothetical protein